MRSTCITKGKSSPHKRRGVLLIVVLACVAIISLLLGAMVTTTMNWRRQVRYETWNTQANWLAESGLHKAVSELGANPNYEGETWQLETEDGLAWPATVEIEVKEQAGTQTISVSATFAEETGRPVRAHRTLTLGTAETKKD